MERQGTIEDAANGPNAQEKFAAAELMNAASESALGELTAYSNWLTAGTGAAFGLVVLNLESILRSVDEWSLRAALLCLAGSMATAMVCRFVGSVVAAGLAGREKAKRIGEAAGSSGQPIDLDITMHEFARAYLPPNRWLVAWSLRKIKGGDLTFGARMTVRTVQLQGLVVLLQIVLCVAAVAFLAFGLSPAKVVPGA